MTMWQRLALFCLRRALNQAQARIWCRSYLVWAPDVLAPWDRRLSGELDRLRIAIEALERVSVDRGAR